MTATTTALLIGAFIVVGVVSAFVMFVISRRRHKRDLREFLEPDLQKCGVSYVSSCYPGLFEVGPFPNIEFERGRPQSNVGGIRGEYSEYRTVKIRDAQGGIYQLWAKVEFEVFKFRRVRWRAEQKTSLPANVLSILEN
jgi:hypothetical protein